MNDRAFTALVAAERPRLLRIAGRIVGPTDAEDIVQAACMRAWVETREGRELTSPRGWLTVVTRNLSLNLAYRSHRTDLDLLERDGAHSGIDDEVIARDELRRATQEIRRLPDQQRAVITAAAVGIGPVETAEQLGFTNRAAIAALHRARTTLRASAVEAAGTDA